MKNADQARFCQSILPVKLSVVIPAYNEEKLLPQTLEALKEAMGALDKAGVTTEVIVCDNNSSDHTAELARAAGARVVFEPLNQIGRARNTGAAVATGEWILFLDADSTPSAALLADLAVAMADPKVIGGGSTLRLDLPFGVHTLFLRFWNRYSRWRGQAAGAFFYCRAEAFREVGGFSSHLYASEELDLSKRLIAFGEKRGQRMRILTKNPMLTSGRKVKLYSAGEYARFFFQTAWRRGRNLQSRDQCTIWYDGRR